MKFEHESIINLDKINRIETTIDIENNRKSTNVEIESLVDNIISQSNNSLSINLKSLIFEGLISSGFDCDLPDIQLFGITSDSREVRKGYIFAAINGKNLNGEKFIKDAIRNGARVILIDMQVAKEIACHFYDKASNLIFLKSTNVRKALAFLAGLFYPKMPKFIGVVTGTNGKSSIVTFARQLWGILGYKCASFGTLGLFVDGIEKSNIPQIKSLTTPDVVELRQTLNFLKDKEINYCAFEASSHGLDQFRLDGVDIKVAVFSNFSHEHLDYHKTMQGYFEAKMRLFNELLPPSNLAILCSDDSYFEEVKAICESRNHTIWTYGKKGKEFKIIDIINVHTGQNLICEIFGESYNLYLPFSGCFQAYNVLAAIGLVFRCSHTKIDSILSNVSELQCVTGRMECIANSFDKMAFVDYAHKPQALENILMELKLQTKNQLILVFGCGGDRDVKKRGLMGQIASQYADKVIITDDNPRTENPAKIRQAIFDKCPKAIEIGDREAAIRRGISEMTAGDVLLVAGKGHETSQIIENVTFEFNDADIIRKYWKFSEIILRKNK